MADKTVKLTSPAGVTVSVRAEQADALKAQGFSGADSKSTTSKSSAEKK